MPYLAITSWSERADRRRQRRARGFRKSELQTLPSNAAGFCHQRPHQDADYREVGHEDR